MRANLSVVDFIETTIVAFAAFLLVGGSIAYLSSPRAAFEDLGPMDEPAEPTDPCKWDDDECEDVDDEDDDNRVRDDDRRGKGGGKDRDRDDGD